MHTLCILIGAYLILVLFFSFFFLFFPSKLERRQEYSYFLVETYTKLLVGGYLFTGKY